MEVLNVVGVNIVLRSVFHFSNITNYYRTVDFSVNHSYLFSTFLTRVVTSDSVHKTHLLKATSSNL